MSQLAADGSQFTLVSFRLTVPLEVETNPNDLTVLVGRTANFTCSFSGSPAPDSIQWFREGDDAPLTGVRYSITDTDFSSQISFVTQLDDHGTTYYCRAVQSLVGGRIDNVSTDAATLTVNCKLACVEHMGLGGCLLSVSEEWEVGLRRG